MSWFRFPTEVNERAARLVAGTVASTIVVAYLTGATWVLPLLAVGFWLRAGFGPRVSPLAKLAVKLAHRLGEPILVPGPPKRFAQLLGAVALSVASLLAFGGSAPVGWAIAGAVAVLASFEASLAACLGCWLYGRCVVPLRRRTPLAAGSSH